MEAFVQWSVFSTGIFLVIYAMLMQTKNWYSSVLFKVLPMLFGLACLVSALYLFGWLNAG